MQIRILPAGPIQTNAYLLTAPQRREAVLIDAPEGVWDMIRPILEQEGCRLSELWLTHGHWDHTQGAAEVVRVTGAKVSGHSADRRLFEHPEVMAQFLGEDLQLEPVPVDRWLEGGEFIEALGIRAEVRHVPGHCPGNVLFHIAGNALHPEGGFGGIAFVGDALFAGGVGRTDLPGGDSDELERSIRTQIYTLPDSTAVLSGHGPPTTVGAEKRANPFVRS